MKDDSAEMVEISRLVPWKRNPRVNDPAISMLAAGIRRFGWTNPVLARRSDNRVVAGHTRLKAASLIRSEGIREGDHATVSTVLAGAVPVRWGEWSDAEADALTLADNRLGEIATWDDAALAEILAGLGDDAFGLGWSDDEIENDDLSATDLRQLLTDTLGMTLAHTRPGAVWYVAAPSGPLFLEFGTVLQAFDVWRHTLAWVKNAAVFGRCDYHYRHESLFYGWTPGAAHLAPTDHTLTSVLEHNRPGPSDKAHPTMKPLSLVSDCIRNSSRPGWLIGEPFCGSGTTLLAAAAESRICRAIELDPRYCDVIRRRWTKYARENNLEVGDGLDG